MSGFLLLLVKGNLAMGAAIVLVSLIRRPLRAQFGAPIAYAIWLLVPIASVASLLPPREVPAPAHVASVHAPLAPIPVTGHGAHSALRAIEQLAGQSALMPLAPMKPLASTYGMFDTSLLPFAAWVVGTLFMAGYLTRVQIRFSAAVRRGQAGPAVLGFLRPRIVTPDGFGERFTSQEQSAILAHERVHLARQDARINALAAFLRCFCWFNPLIHLGARWLRIDQELACDATTVSGEISRRDYSMALLKSQVLVGVLPFGCNWPGPQHPLVERIALLQRKPPGTARRIAGLSLVLLTATSVGLGAWATQPPIAAKPVTGPSIELATLPAMVAAPGQTAGEPAATVNPDGSGNDVDTSKNVRANEAVSAGPAPETPSTGSSEARTQSAIAALSQTDSVSEPSNKTDQSAYSTSRDASPEPKDTLARNTAGRPATGEVTTADAASDASSTAASGPRTRTEPYLGCYLGFGPWTCPNSLVTPRRWCGEAYEYRLHGDCGQDGPLEKVDYLGTNAVGADVYEAQYRHTDMTYVVVPPGPHGKGYIWSKRGNPGGVIPSSTVEVPSSAANKMTLYTAPWQ